MAGLALLNHYSSGPGTSMINSFLFHGASPEPGLMALRFGGSIISYLSGAAGGIFSPSLAIGGTIGSYLSSFIGTDHGNLMVLLGMIGFLTGVTRTPFTSFILVLEMTDRHSAIFPMMIAALTAHWTSRLIDSHSFYEHVKQRYLVGIKSAKN